MTWLELPLPPSANNLYINVPKRGRVIAPAYREWLAEAVPLVHFAATGRDMHGKLQGPPAAVSGPYAIHLQAGKINNRRRDLGNFWKPLEDCLKKGGLIQDDSLCQRQEGEWLPGFDGLRVLVLPTQERV